MAAAACSCGAPVLGCGSLAAHVRRLPRQAAWTRAGARARGHPRAGPATPAWPLLACVLQVSLLESRDERMSEGGSGTAAAAYVPPSPRSARARARLPPPAAEIHLQVASLRESNADYRKFYVHSGTSTLTLRAESKEDRWVWMQALQTWCAAREGGVPGRVRCVCLCLCQSVCVCVLGGRMARRRAGGIGSPRQARAVPWSRAPTPAPAAPFSAPRRRAQQGLLGGHDAGGGERPEAGCRG